MRRLRRWRERVAFGCVLLGLAALPLALLLGWPALVLGLCMPAIFLAAGWLALRERRAGADLPAPPSSLSVVSRVAMDEAMLGFMQYRTATPPREELPRIAAELDAALAHARREGWSDPELLHAAPPPARDVAVRPARLGRRAYEQLAFASEYAPPAGAPGRERWLALEPNRTAHAALICRDPAAPWLLCLHGYRMGSPRSNFWLFDPDRIADPLNLNLATLSLPLHGPRQVGGRSGDRFLDGRVVDTVWAFAQSVWDARRLLGWLRRERGARRIGLYGVSLGSCVAGLLAGLDDELHGALLGLPLVDVPDVLWRHGPPELLADFEASGVTPERVRRLLAPVSPLRVKPRIPVERASLYAAAGDRIVPPEHALRLQRHWGGPELLWAHGGHLTFHQDPRFGAHEAASLRRIVA